MKKRMTSSQMSLVDYAMKRMIVNWSPNVRKWPPRFRGEAYLEITITEYEGGCSIGLMHEDATEFSKSDAIEIVQRVGDRKFKDDWWTIDSITVSIDGDLEDTPIKINATLFVDPWHASE